MHLCDGVEATPHAHPHLRWSQTSPYSGSDTHQCAHVQHGEAVPLVAYCGGTNSSVMSHVRWLLRATQHRPQDESGTQGCARNDDVNFSAACNPSCDACTHAEINSYDQPVSPPVMLRLCAEMRLHTAISVSDEVWPWGQFPLLLRQQATPRRGGAQSCATVDGSDVSTSGSGLNAAAPPRMLPADTWCSMSTASWACVDTHRRHEPVVQCPSSFPSASPLRPCTSAMSPGWTRTLWSRDREAPVSAITGCNSAAKLQALGALSGTLGPWAAEAASTPHSSTRIDTLRLL
jgi:hypothetical protein